MGNKRRRLASPVPAQLEGAQPKGALATHVVADVTLPCLCAAPRSGAWQADVATDVDDPKPPPPTPPTAAKSASAPTPPIVAKAGGPKRSSALRSPRQSAVQEEHV